MDLPELKGEIVNAVCYKDGVLVFTTEAVYQVTRVAWYQKLWRWLKDAPLYEWLMLFLLLVLFTEAVLFMCSIGAVLGK